MSKRLSLLVALALLCLLLSPASADPGTAGLLGPTVDGYNASYRLDPREAIVILGELPPPAAYFGLQTYLLSRPGEWDTTSSQYLFVQQYVPALLHTFFTKLPNNPERVQLFADLSDPINNVVIQNGSSAVWDQVRYLQYFARDCTGLEALTEGSHCYSIGDQLPDCPDPTDLTCAMLVLSLRDYLLPGSPRGPAPELTLNPLVIALQRP